MLLKNTRPVDLAAHHRLRARLEPGSRKRLPSLNSGQFWRAARSGVHVDGTSRVHGGSERALRRAGLALSSSGASVGKGTRTDVYLREVTSRNLFSATLPSCAVTRYSHPSMTGAPARRRHHCRAGAGLHRVLPRGGPPGGASSARPADERRPQSVDLARQRAWRAELRRGASCRASLWDDLPDAGRGVPNGEGGAHNVAVWTRDGSIQNRR